MIIKTVKKGITLALICLCHCQMTQAQSYIQDIQKKGTNNAQVTVTHSKEIDNVVNGDIQSTETKTVEKVTPITNTATGNIETPKKTEQVIKNEKPQKTETVTKTEPTVKPENTVKKEQTIKKDSFEKENVIPVVKKILRRGRLTQGFRVRVFMGDNSRVAQKKAMQIKSKLENDLPEEYVTVHFKSPKWICEVGNYRTVDEARAMLRQISALGYREAFVVRQKIIVPYY